jgi:gliding motility-associated-like protein
MGDTSVYVTVSNASNCQTAYGTLYHVVNMQNGNTSLLRGEGARLYDSGGELGNYGDNENLTYTFSCPGENQLDVVINSLDIAIGDTLYIYSGMAALPGSLLAALTHTSSVGNLTVHQSAVTFHFKSNWVNNRGGWNIDIYTGVPMTAVMAHVSPLNYDTVAAVVCASLTPYETPYFPPLDISQSREYLTDTLITSGDGCQTIVHLHLVVNPVSQTAVQESLMPCQLPYTWNGITFTDYGTQTAVLTNEFNCDSLVTMTLFWAPPVDSTTIYDTIVENQLPYIVNGVTFTGPGMQQATLVNQQGCDSVVTMYLHVFYNVSAEADLVICDNELPLIWNGVTFTQTDTQMVTLTAYTGADSVLTMRLWVNPTHQTVFADTTCQHTEYNNYGFVLSEHETSASGLNTFTRTLPNQFGCDSVIVLNLLVTPDITPDFYAEPDKALLSENAEIQFINHTDESDLAQMNYFWVWDFGDGNSDTTYGPNTEHTYTQWGDYTVTLTLVANGCESSYSILVIIEADLKFPNVITPNGDGVNDVFIIKDLNPERSNHLQIVDRWGKVVFQQTNYQTYMKDDYVYNVDSGFGMGDVPDGVYYYTFYYKGMVRTLHFNGTITVIKDRN